MARMHSASLPGTARPAASPPGGGFRLVVSRRGRSRSVAVGGRAAFAALAVAGAVTAWAGAAGLYVCFHDELLASLIARQADMQYGYEDQIAQLRTELDRRTSRGLVDRHTIDATLRDLDARSRQLEARAAATDALVADALARAGTAHPPGGGHADSRDAATAPREVPPASPGAAPLPADAEDHAAADAVGDRLALVERFQAADVSALREPLARRVRRLASALADAGLPGRSARAARGTGGPFVPPAGAGGFDAEVAVLRDALDQADRLAASADRVPLRKPLAGPVEVSSPFGARPDPFLGRPALHTGVDLLQSGDDTVRATAAGVVTVAGENGGYGRMVEVDHGDGLATRYAHLATVAVVPGQRVAAGAALGRVGSSGRATGPHLHYETRVDGEPVDPARFIAAGARLDE